MTESGSSQTAGGNPGDRANCSFAGLNQAEMEAAALEGRQVAGQIEKSTALRLAPRRRDDDRGPADDRLERHVLVPRCGARQ